MFSSNFIFLQSDHLLNCVLKCPSFPEHWLLLLSKRLRILTFWKVLKPASRRPGRIHPQERQIHALQQVRPNVAHLLVSFVAFQHPDFLAALFCDLPEKVPDSIQWQSWGASTDYGTKRSFSTIGNSCVRQTQGLSQKQAATDANSPRKPGRDLPISVDLPRSGTACFCPAWISQVPYICWQTCRRRDDRWRQNHASYC